MKRVLLVNMPFVSLLRPALGISLLKARLAQEGIESEVAYENLHFAERAGFEPYNAVDRHISLALFPGEWLFAQSAFGKQLDLQNYAETVRRNVDKLQDYETLLQMRHDVPPYLHEAMARWDWDSYDIIGFTSTFQQNMPSLLLSGMIKKEFPDKTIVMGGANCEGAMGMQIHSSFKWVDYICSGESDNSFPELVKRLRAHASVDGIPGVIYRDGDTSRRTGDDDQITDMDGLPDPDFDDYFAALEKSSLRDRIQPSLQIESARGCWWGAKAHCTFCGLNGQTMAFRAKSSDRILGEIERQIERYKIKRFQAVDNIIPHEYYRTVLPALAERQLGATFFYEIKSNIRKKHVQLLADAGVMTVQPGIESLSTHVLKLMRKGVWAIQNIQMLKWCKEYGVDVAWNLLFGFPGETEEDYKETSRYIGAICHLQPPGGAKPIRLDRFSPNFVSAKDFGFTDIRPFAIYRFIYPLPEEAVTNLAYFFEYRYADGQDPTTYTGEVVRQVDAWRRLGGGTLTMRFGDDRQLIITEGRQGRQPRQYALKGVQRDIYERCEEVCTKKILLDLARESHGDDERIVAGVEVFLDQMVQLDLMVREGDQFLSLAISETVRKEAPPLAPVVLKPVQDAIEAL